MARAPKSPKAVDALKHDAATRRNIPTAEMESFFQREEDSAPMPPTHYPRARPLPAGTTRTEEEPSVPEIIWNGARITITEAQMAELAETGTLTLSDAQLVWRGKDKQDWSDLVVNVPPLYIQEKIHPKAIIDDLKRRTTQAREATTDAPDLFADFNGIAPDQRAEFYQHDQHWSNRMILGDSLQVMASLAERESLKGKVQCIYFDPPYGIKFNSNWQIKTSDRNVQDGKQNNIAREPEVTKAFRDTWRDGVHSYLSYLRDRLTIAKDLLNESGSAMVQIGEENLHLVRSLMGEVFGDTNFVTVIAFAKTVGSTSKFVGGMLDYIVWFAKDKNKLKYRQLFKEKEAGGEGAGAYTRLELPDLSRRSMTSAERANTVAAASIGRIFTVGDLTSARVREGRSGYFPITLNGQDYLPPKREWSTHRIGCQRLVKANRVAQVGAGNIGFVRYLDDFPVTPLTNLWGDTMGQNQYGGDKVYVVQTQVSVVQRCLLMATDPGDLVLDPTCGSGTTAYVAEQWGRRWITIDTSRVSLALARTRLMAARYPWYLLADSRDGQAKEAALTARAPAERSTSNDIRQGFVYERAPHIGVRSIANNPLIDDIWEKWQAVLEPLRAELNAATGESWEEWQILRELPASAPPAAAGPHARW